MNRPPPPVARALRPAALALVIGAAVGTATGGTAGWALGLTLGPALGVAADRWLRVQPSLREAAERREIVAELPFAADLLAAALRAGAAPDSAARCVGTAIGGALGARLNQVDRALALGAPADEAWWYLGQHAECARIVQAAVRSQHSGAAFANALHRLADDLRADRLIAADAAAKRAAVLIVLPLGLCFLPAFVLAGLVPVIVAVLGDVLSP